VSPATYKPPLWTAASCNTQGLGLFGGNPNLTPETSQNFNLGVIVSPVTDMGITIDYYRILIENTISTVPAAAIYANPTQFANYIVTNNAGTLTPSIASALDCTPFSAPTCGYVQQQFQNTGRVTTDGIDLSVQYLQRTPIGTFHEDLEGTSVTQFQLQQYTGGPYLNLVGWFNTQPPVYRWQHLLRIDWDSPGGMWGAGVLNRLYSNYIDEFPNGAGQRQIVGGYSTVDAYASVKPIPNLQVLFGIKNIGNHLPPYTNASEPNGNFSIGYNTYVVDPNLRTFYLNLRYTFF
jgi:iron complex outermembrane recepter protein